MKRCATCREDRDESEFSPGEYRCKPCNRERVRQYRLRNPETVRARMRRWVKANPDKMKVAQARWRAANPEYGQRWRDANPEKVKEYNKRSKERRTKQIRIEDQLRRFREKAVPRERIDRLDIYERDGGICGICDQPVERDAFHLDHIVPIAMGGPHLQWNVRITHPSCNMRRGKRLNLTVYDPGPPPPEAKAALAELPVGSDAFPSVLIELSPSKAYLITDLSGRTLRDE